ncbi:antigen-presenting glycoprotein CD1d-like isoform X1 [Pelodiscus sinensis]|uniref:antigen-presenting glycoprotein CD1d-like isoform X1 n=1 Tax=Pelodiscus sinensis TaxID=13735 RepID=UPI003F6D8DEA
MGVTRGPSSRCPDARPRALLPLLLLPGLWGGLAGPVTFRLLQTDDFPNASCSHMQGVALLADLETHSMNCSTCPIRFLQPWARQGLTPKQWQELEQVIHRYLFNFVRLVNRLAQKQGQSYPFVTQCSIHCELHPNGSSRGSYDVALSGRDFLSLDTGSGTWVARSAEKPALDAQEYMSHDRITTVTLLSLLRATCVNEIRSFVQYGNASLHRRERPVAVVFVREPPPAEPPMPWLLVCRVTGFYPRAVRVAWLQDGEEVEPGWRLNSSGILPNADLTYQLRSSLAVGPGDGHSYACRVQHSSLGGRSLLIPWEHSRHRGPGLAVGITLGALAVAVAVAVVLWRCRRRLSHPPAAANRCPPQRQLLTRGGGGPAGRPGDPLHELQHLPHPLPAALGPAGPDPQRVAGAGADDPSLPVQLHPPGEQTRAAAGPELPYCYPERLWLRAAPQRYLPGLL